MTQGRQPYLHDAVIVLRAPTQAWSRADGDMRGAIDGVYHGDRRFLSRVDVRCAGERPVAIGSVSPDVSSAEFDAVLRGIDDETPDPRVRLTRRRQVEAGRMSERLVIRSVSTDEVRAPLTVTLVPDFRPLHEVKLGAGMPRPWQATVVDGGVRVQVPEGSALLVTAPDAAVDVDAEAITLRWDIAVTPRSETVLSWRVDLDDPSLVVRAAAGPGSWAAAAAARLDLSQTGAAGLDPRLRRWVSTALDDLDALRLALPDRPADEFLAAGAPWFLTLFGRDCLWAARLLLPLDVGLAGSTLRVLARLQGSVEDTATAQQPGKMVHELRAGQADLPASSPRLPPLYYGTVDATALWVCLLVDAAAAGLPPDEVRELLPVMRAALDWIVGGTGDDFLRYVDGTGQGLANQGWKDSDDSVQWRDGVLAAGPIALCEVQGYSYEAATGAAALLDSLGEPGAEALRGFAAGLRNRFHSQFWVDTPEGRYPAVALDRDGRAVDSLTSNIGHLLGTGLLDPDQEREVAALLGSASMSSGFGVRTLSARSAGFWPLGYHTGSVWAHDTAIIARAMAKAGHVDQAIGVVDGLIDAAEAFGYRIPELYGGDARADRPAPVSYPAACRPQAWSAAAAVTCMQIAETSLLAAP